MKEFNLSEKIMFQIGDEEFEAPEVIEVEDVKKFIKLVKIKVHQRMDMNDFNLTDDDVNEEIDKLAGEKLK